MASTLMLATAVAAAAASPPPATGSDRVTLPTDTPTQAVANGTDAGPTDPNTPMQVSIILRARNVGALQHDVELGWSRPYLSTAQFAAAYGGPAGVIGGIQTYLAGFGIQTTPYADGLDISATGTVGEFSQALVVRERNFDVREPNVTGSGAHPARVFAPTSGPTLPRPVGSWVLAIMGLSNYASTTSNLKQMPAAARRADESDPGGFSNPPSTFSDRYGLTPVLNTGARGQGRTIGIITFAPFDPANAYTFWNDVLGLGVPHGRILVEPIDGGSGSFLTDGTTETDLDVEEAGAIAPAASLRVYESGQGDAAWVDPFFAAASDNAADAVSVSWGHSETIQTVLQDIGLEPTTYMDVLDEAYLEMAAQGQTAFAASGDNGAYQALADLQSTNLSVNYPSDSPYVTSAGGSTLPGVQSFQAVDRNGNRFGPSYNAAIPAERAWGSDYIWPLYQAFGFPSQQAAATDMPGGWQLGTGGGFSTLEHRPAYQSSAIAFQDRQYLTPTDLQPVIPGVLLPAAFAFHPTPGLGHGGSTTGRGEPDLAANADSFTGYEIYDGEFGGLITGAGGTSVVAPQLAGAAAVIDSADGGRTGFWNPPMYRAANSVSGSPFTPLNSTTVYSGINYLFAIAPDGTRTVLPGGFSNDNLFFTGSPFAVWNPATGLGLPNLARIAQVVAPH